MEKIGESPWSLGSDIVDTHHILFLNNKIWMFSRNYVVQDAHSFGHSITYRGGYVISFDLKTRVWSSKSVFPSLCDDDNLEEAVFVQNNRIFLLLFKHFGGVSFKHLYYFDDVQCNWHSVKSFQVNAECNREVEDAAWKSDLIHIEQDFSSHDSLFMVSNESFVTIVQLSLDNNLAAHLSLVYKRDEKPKLRRPVKAARVSSKIFWLEGSHGCGFRIQPDTLMVYDMENKVESEQKVDGDYPPFSFTGAMCTAIFPSGEWIHALGCTAVGISSAKFCGQVWQLMLNGTELKWEKLAPEIADCTMDKVLATFSENKTLYVVDPIAGILMANL